MAGPGTRVPLGPLESSPLFCTFLCAGQREKSIGSWIFVYFPRVPFSIDLVNLRLGCSLISIFFFYFATGSGVPIRMGKVIY